MNKINNTNCSASDIYYRMLQIGSEHTENGISLNEIKNKLQSECLVSNPQNTEHIHQWFSWSFEHKEFGCKCPRNFNDDPCGCNQNDPCNQFDHDSKCNRFLTKDSIIEFSQLEQSHKLNEQIKLNKQQVDLLQNQLSTLNSQIQLTEQNSKDAKMESKSAKNYAIGALIATAFFGLPDILDFCENKFSTKKQHEDKQIKEAQILQKSQLQLSNHLLDSVNQVLTYQLRMEIQDSIYLKTINESLKTLNNNLKRDKK
jgi:hypothetical protein